MNQCNTCGVEFDDEKDICPLCGTPLVTTEPDEQSGSLKSGDRDDAAGSPPIDPAERRKARLWLWEMFSIVIVASAIIVSATDFGYGFDLSWSVYPLTALAFVWLFVTAVITLGRDIPLAFGACLIVVLVYLFVLDALVAGDPWFVSFALPVTLLVSIAGGGAAGAVRSLKLSIFQTLAVSVFSAGIFVLGLEITLYFAMDLESILSWSIVAFGGCLSIALLLLLINKRLRERHADFKRVFHL